MNFSLEREEGELIMARLRSNKRIMVYGRKGRAGGLGEKTAKVFETVKRKAKNIINRVP